MLLRFTFYVFLAIAFSVVLPETCKEKAIKADKCVKRAFFFGEEMNIPRTIDEYNAYCRLGKEIYKCARNYRQCLSKFPRQVFNLFLESTKKAMRQNCDKHVNREEILHHLKCFDKESIKPMMRCAEAGLVRLEHIANHSKDENIIADVCCLSHLQVECVTDEIVKQCPQRGKEVGDFAIRMLNMYAGELLDLACRRYPNINECSKVNPKGMLQLRRINGTVAHFGERLWIDPPLRLAARLVN